MTANETHRVTEQSDYSPKPMKLNLKINSNGLFPKKGGSKQSSKRLLHGNGMESKKKLNINDTTYLLGSNMMGSNFF
jgi:hypothetical protein